MKKITFLCIAISMMCLSACSSDDDSITPDSLSLVGEWKITKLHVAGTASQGTGGMTVSTDFEMEVTNLDDEDAMAFNEDNTFTASSGNGVNIHVTIEFMGEEMNSDMQSDPSTEEGSWELNNDKLILNYGSDTQPVTYDIVSMSQSKLELVTNQMPTMFGYDGGDVLPVPVDAGAEIQAHLTLER